MLARSLILSAVLTAVGVITAMYFPQYVTVTTIAVVFPVRLGLFWWAGWRAQCAITDELLGVKEAIFSEEKTRRHAARHV